MADKLQLLIEAERRGILPPEKKALLDEARKRGLIGGQAAAPQTGQTGQPTPQAEGRSYPEELLRQVGLAGRYVAKGLSAIPTIIGDPVNTTINMGIRGVNEVANAVTSPSLSETIIGEREPLIPYLSLPSDKVQQTLDYVGLPKPENAMERIISYPSQMLAGMGTTKAIGSVAKEIPGAVSGLYELAKGLPQQAGGAIGGGLSQGVTAEVTDNPFAQFIAAMAGGAAGGKIADKMVTPRGPAIPTTKEVKAESKQLFKAAEETDAILTPAPLQRLTQQVQQDATEFGYLPSLQPRINAVLQELDRVSKSNITIKGMMTLRKVAQNAANSTDDAERALGAQIIGRIDDTMSALGPDDVLQGNADDAAALWAQGRELWGQFKKSETIDKALKKADRAADSSGTGGNTDNALRQKIKAILDNDKKVRGFTKDEIAQMEAIVKGAPLTNLARQIGRFSPTTGYLPAAFSIGAYGLGGAPAAAIPAVGLLGKLYADRTTRGAIESLSELIRTGGRFAPPPVNQAPPPSLLGLLPAASQASGLLGLVPESQRRPQLAQ